MGLVTVTSFPTPGGPRTPSCCAERATADSHFVGVGQGGTMERRRGTEVRG